MSPGHAPPPVKSPGPKLRSRDCAPVTRLGGHACPVSYPRRPAAGSPSGAKCFQRAHCGKLDAPCLGSSSSRPHGRPWNMRARHFDMTGAETGEMPSPPGLSTMRAARSLGSTPHVAQSISRTHSGTLAGEAFGAWDLLQSALLHCVPPLHLVGPTCLGKAAPDRDFCEALLRSKPRYPYALTHVVLQPPLVTPESPSRHGP